jgi:hypothetical protein
MYQTTHLPLAEPPVHLVADVARLAVLLPERLAARHGAQHAGDPLGGVVHQVVHVIAALRQLCGSLAVVLLQLLARQP